MWCICVPLGNFKINLLKKSKILYNIIVFFVFFAGALAFVSYLGATDFGNKFELITGSNFNNKTPVLVFLIGGLANLYFAIYRFWSFTSSRLYHYYIMLSAVIVIISTLGLIIWLLDVKSLIEFEFLSINFPTNVDVATRNIRSSLVSSIIAMFTVFSAIGTVALILSVAHFRYRSKSD